MISTLDYICVRLNGKVPEVLLRKRDNEAEPAYGEFTIIGGMVWENRIDGSEVYDKTLSNTSSRILEMKVGKGFNPSYMEVLEPMGGEDRDSRGWSITIPHLCLFKHEDTFSLSDNGNFIWVSLEEVVSGEHKLPFDHNKLVSNAYESLINKCKYSSILFYLLSRLFTVANVVSAFNSFGYEVSKQTVINRWVKKELIVATGGFIQNLKGGKPASVYKVVDDQLQYFDFSVGGKGK